MQTTRVHRMPRRLSFFLLAFLVTLPFSAAGDPVPDVVSDSEAKPIHVAGAPVSGVPPSSKANSHIEKPDDASKSFDGFKPQTFGWIEQVILSPELRWKLDAKLDTGADTSSLDAHDIRRIRYRGESYVRFSIKNPESAKMISLRRPYVRTVRIRSHSGNHQRRRVVLMTVCMGNAERTIEVTLTDREHFDYPMLLGRSALSGVALVNPMATHITEPNCKTDFSEVEDGEIDMPVELDKRDSGVAGKSAQGSQLPVDKSSINSRKIPPLPNKSTGSEQKPKNVPTEATSDGKSANLSTQSLWYVPSGRSVVTPSHTMQRSGSHHVRS